jgi:hypothetical protein
MSNTAKFFCTRVLLLPEIYLDDTESTFEELQARITRTIEILRSVDEAGLDGKKVAEEPVIMKTGKMGDFKFESGQAYLSEYAIPNFHFHMTTSYCILRHLGVPLGAFDYMSDVFHKV